MATIDQRACLCGCGAVPKLATSRYVPGHDRTHIEQLVSDVLAGRDEAGARAELSSPEAQDEFGRRLQARG